MADEIRVCRSCRGKGRVEGMYGSADMVCHMCYGSGKVRIDREMQMIHRRAALYPKLVEACKCSLGALVIRGDSGPATTSTRRILQSVLAEAERIEQEASDG